MKYSNAILRALFCFFVCANFTYIQAQGKLKNKAAKFGIEAGVNIGAFWGVEVQEGDKGSPGIGLNAGIFGYYHVIGDVDFRPSLKYSYTGASFDSVRELQQYPTKVDGFPIYIDVITETTGEVDIHYFEMPLEFVLNFGERLAIQIGPRLGYLATGKVEGEIQPYLISTLQPTDLEQLEDHLVLNKKSFEIRGGLGLSFKLTKKSQVGASIVFGFNEVNSPTENYTDQLKNVFATTSFAYNIFGEY